VVDDSTSFGDLAAALLEREPCAEVVGVARSGAQALEMVVTNEPELVLMDVNMSPMSGLTASALICWLFPETRVVLMSTDDSPRLRADCTASGAEGFIHKAAFISDFFTAVGPIARDVLRDRFTLMPVAKAAALATAS
jgi:DNA-binding NarL/FixJ family response regulator